MTLAALRCVCTSTTSACRPFSLDCDSCSLKVWSGAAATGKDRKSESNRVFIWEPPENRRGFRKLRTSLAAGQPNGRARERTLPNPGRAGVRSRGRELLLPHQQISREGVGLDHAFA